MQDTIKEHLRKIALPALLATGGMAAFDCGAVPSALSEWTREKTGISLDARKAEAALTDVAVMPELAGVTLGKPGLQQAIDALTNEHVPGNPAETAKAAMWQLYRLAEANQGDTWSRLLMESFMFQAMGKYLESVHWGKYNQTGDLGGFENFIPYDKIDIAEIPPIYIKETKRGRVIRRKGGYTNPPHVDGPDARTGEQWGIEYNGDNARTFNTPWFIYCAKTFNAAANTAALDYANYLLSHKGVKPIEDLTVWRAQQKTPQMMTDIMDGRYGKGTGKAVPNSVNPYTMLSTYKKGHAIKSAADLAKFAETGYIFLAPPPPPEIKLEGLQKFWNASYGVSDKYKQIPGCIPYMILTNQASGVTGFYNTTRGLLMPDQGLAYFAPQVKSYREKTIKQVADTLKKVDGLEKDTKGNKIVINGIKTKSALPAPALDAKQMG
jgi:hypothetical protein